MSDYSTRVYRLFVFRACALCVLLFLTSTPLGECLSSTGTGFLSSIFLLLFVSRLLFRCLYPLALLSVDLRHSSHRAAAKSFVFLGGGPAALLYEGLFWCSRRCKSIMLHPGDVTGLTWMS